MKTTNNHKDTSLDLQPDHYRYPGSRPFQTGEEKKFYGRENEIIQLVNLVELERLVVVYARSGLGKTSLINAGLIPQLEKRKLDFSKLREPQLRDSSKNYYAPIIPIRLNDPDTSPDESVYNALLPYLEESNLFDQKSPCLWDLIKAMNLSMANTPILVFDQFEELFNLFKEQKRKKIIFELADVVNNNVPYSIKEILEEWISEDDDILTNEHLQKIKSTEEPLRVKIVIAIRADKISFLDELSQKVPSILKNRFKLKALKKEQAKLAISIPANLTEDFSSPPFEYDNELLNNIVEFLSTERMDDEEIETDKVESFQLQILCQYIESEVIKRKKVGQLNKALSNGVIKIDESYLESEEKMKGVLENFYDDSISEHVPLELQKGARQLIEKGLIIEGGYRNSTSKNSILNDYKIPESVLSKLVNCHLLRHERRLGQDFYEISHDTLVGPITKSHERRITDQQKVQVSELEKENTVLQSKTQKNSFLIKSLLGILFVALCGFGFFKDKAMKEEKTLRQKIRLHKEKEKTAKLEIVNNIQSRTNNLIYQSSLFKESDPTLSYRLAKAALAEDSTSLLGKKNLFDLIKSSASYPFYQILGEKDISIEGYEAEIEFSKDGNLLISDHNGHVYLVDKKGNFKQQLDLEGKNYVTKFFPKSNNQFITAGDGGVYIRTLSNRSAKPIKLPHEGKGRTVDAADISLDGKKIISGDRKGYIKLWDRPFKKENQKDIQVHSGHITEVLFSANGKWIISTGWDKTINISSIDSFQVSGSKVLFSEQLENRVMSADVVDAADDKMLVFGLDDGSIGLWKISEEKIEPRNQITSIDSLEISNIAKPQTKVVKEVLTFFKGHQSAVNDLKFIKNGKYILSASSDNTAKMWDLQGNLIKTFLGHHPLKVDAIAFNGKQMVTVSSTRDDNPSKILKWDLNFADLTQPYPSEVQQILETPNYMLVSCPDIDSLDQLVGTLLYINDLKGKTIAEPIRLPFSVLSINKKSNKEMVLVTGSKDGKSIVCEVNLRSRKYTPIKNPHASKSCYALEFINNNEVLTIGGDRQIIRWNPNNKNQEPLAFSRQTSQAGYSFDYDTNNKVVLSGHSNGEAYLWDLKGNLLDTLKGHSGKILVVKISPDGKTLLTAGDDRNIKLWTLEKNKTDNFKAYLRHTFQGHSFRIKQLDFSRESNTFLSASDDGIVKVWSYDNKVDQYNELPSFIRHEQPINAARFTIKGDGILTGSGDMTVKEWEKDVHYNTINNVAELKEDVALIIKTEIEKDQNPKTENKE